MKTQQTKIWQVGGKGGRRFATLTEAETYEQTVRHQDGIFRSIVKTATRREREIERTRYDAMSDSERLTYTNGDR